MKTDLDTKRKKALERARRALQDWDGTFERPPVGKLTAGKVGKLVCAGKAGDLDPAGRIGKWVSRRIRKATAR